jgi:fluoride exporter
MLAAIGAVGGLGAIARFLLDAAVADRWGRGFPYGTLLVNLVGSFVLGLAAGIALDRDTYRVIATGLIGGFTTFSTWALESHRLGEDGRVAAGAANFAVSLALGIVCAWAGRRLGMTLL